MRSHLQPIVGEHYYFDRPFQAAGIIKRLSGEDTVLRGMTFTEGECIADCCHKFEFRTKVGNTTFHFTVNKEPSLPLQFYTNKPASSP